MNFKAIAVALGLPENATEAEVIAAINKMKTERDNAVTAQATAAKAQAKALVSAAITAGKLVEGDRETYESMAVSNYDFTAKAIEKIPTAKKPSQIIAPQNKATGEETTDETPDTWEKLVAKGESFVAEFKKSNESKYNELLKVYRDTPVK